jgi:thiamine-monophosphate kinase
MTQSNSEFDLIARHLARSRGQSVLGVATTARSLNVTNAWTSRLDRYMVSGTHFFPEVDPEHLGQKALAGPFDMAAMGAMPYWAMLAITLPGVDHAWLGAFAKGFFDLAEEFNVSLVGGDTTRGPSRSP